MNDTKRTLLVSGASGQLGRRVVELLLAAGETVIAGTRTPERLAELAAGGALVRRVDFEDAEDDLVAAFAGVQRLLIVSTDALDVPGRRVRQHRRAIAAARRAGVEHVVYTSLTRPELESPVLIAGDHRETEAALVESGLDYTVLRNNLYMDLLLGSLPAAVAAGQIFSAAGDGEIGYVSREDCARAAAAALVRGSGREVLDVTGPGLVSQDALARIVSEIAGRPVVHVRVTPEQLAAGLRAHGLPAGVAELLVSFDRGAADGYSAVVSDAVERLTGRGAVGVAEFLRGRLLASAAA